MPLVLLSRHRDALMGVAILWVIFFHSRIAIPDGPAWSGIEFVKSCGYGGVEIFFLLSGLGLAFGWSRRPIGYVEFLRRRVIRILPAFWVGIALFQGLTALRQGTWPSCLQLLAAFSGLDFWTGGSCAYWFVPAILAFYLATPPIAHLLWTDGTLRIGRGIALTAASMALSVGVTLGIRAGWFGHAHLLLAWVRIPLFLTGMLIGFGLAQGRSPRLPWPLAAILLGTGGWWLWWNLGRVDDEVLWKTGLWWYPFWPLVLPLSLLAAQALGLMGSSRRTRPVVRMFEWAGRRSLELYLVHTVCFHFLTDADEMPRWFSLDAPWNPARLPEYLGYFLIAALGAELLARGCAKLFPRG
jgi:peptidoglycan/LPS O-acetylase OafA/YrhL